MDYKITLKNPIDVEIGNQFSDSSSVVVQATDIAIHSITLLGNKINVYLVPSNALKGPICLDSCPEELKIAAEALLGEIKKYIVIQIDKKNILNDDVSQI
jgi:hypothetical protein